MLRIRWVNFILPLTITAFTIAALYISLVVVERQKTLREVSRYNLSWVASQAVNETLRFELRLAKLAENPTPDQLAEISTRLDILFNRLGILKQGLIGDYVDRYPEEQQVVHELETSLRLAELLVARLPEPGVTEQLLAVMAPLESRLSRFAASTNRFDGDQLDQDQRDLFRLHWAFSGFAAGLSATNSPV